MDDEGEVFYSLDDGHTRFTDLIQLVEFYQLNRGVLPCKLKHHCARIALWMRDPQRPPRAHMHLNSGAFLDKHSQCSCALKKKDIQTHWTAMLTETTVITHCRPHRGTRSLCYFPHFGEKAEFDSRLYNNWLHVLKMMCSFVWWMLVFGPVMCPYVAVNPLCKVHEPKHDFLYCILQSWMCTANIFF